MNQFRFDEPLAVLLERELMHRHGPMLSNDDLRLALGYSSKEAFRQAISRKTVPIPIFDIENRRGKFALVKDVATWLAAQRERAAQEANNQEQSEQASTRDASKGELP